MATSGHFNMAAVGNNKNTLWSPQNCLVIFTLKVDEGNILAACILNLFRKPRSMICLQTPSFLGRLFKMAVNWLQNRLITNSNLLDPVLFFRLVVETNKKVTQPFSSLLCRRFIFHPHQLGEKNIRNIIRRRLMRLSSDSKFKMKFDEAVRILFWIYRQPSLTLQTLNFSSTQPGNHNIYHNIYMFRWFSQYHQI